MNRHRYAGGDEIYEAQLVRALVNAQADANIRDQHGRTPLMSVHSYRCVVELVKAGADLNARDHLSRTPLIHAVADSNANDALDKRNNVFYELVCRHADVYARDSFGKRAIDYIDVDTVFASRISDVPAPGSNYIRLLLASKYIEGLYGYFKDASWQQIRSDVDSLVKEENDVEDDDEKSRFPFKTYHLTAMRIFAEIMSKANLEARSLVSVQFLADFYYLPYFNSESFKEKLLADVAQRLNVKEQALDDGELLFVKISRARKRQDEIELARLGKLAERLARKSQLVRDFYAEFEKTSTAICQQISRLLLLPPKPEYYTNPNPKFKEYMLKFETVDLKLLKPTLID